MRILLEKLSCYAGYLQIFQCLQNLHCLSCHKTVSNWWVILARLRQCAIIFVWHLESTMVEGSDGVRASFPSAAGLRATYCSSPLAAISAQLLTNLIHLVLHIHLLLSHLLLLPFGRYQWPASYHLHV